MRSLVVASILSIACCAPAFAAGPAPFEIVKQHIDIDVNEDGSFVEVRETATRPLTEAGVRELQQVRLSFTRGFQSVRVPSAYTLKKDGTKIALGPDDFLYAQGATSAPGFEDVLTMTFVFPSLEIGDQVVYTSVFQQFKPWFPGQFSTELYFPRAAVAHDVSLRLTVPAHGMTLAADAGGMQGGTPQNAGNQTLWTWQYDNPVAIPAETGTVNETIDGPHVSVSTFTGYGQVARIYADRIAGKAAVTQPIGTLADQLTQGVTGRREQARALYDWVSTHIAYVAIVLGAGGFIPHEAGEVLQSRYGDCKDHVMLLEALLAAKGIASTPVLIDARQNYRLSTAATPFAFDHMITYVPEFDLFLDSTARHAPFGVLPDSDAGKPVVLVSSGEVKQTPAVTASRSTLRSIANVTVATDGSATGTTTVTATGAAAVDMRAMMEAITADREDDYFRLFLGPGASGEIDRGDPLKLADSYTFSAKYRLANYASLPGPGALRASLGYKPFQFSSLIAGELAASRTRAYACPALSAEDTVTVELPPAVKIEALPSPAQFAAEGTALNIDYERLGANKVKQHVSMRIEHPKAYCDADIYNRARADFVKMLNALNRQILYR